MSKTIPCYLYHKEYGARIFYNQEDIAPAHKAGWQDSPEAFIKASEKSDKNPRVERHQVEKSIETLENDLKQAQKEAREMEHSTVGKPNGSGYDPEQAQKDQEVAAKELQLHNETKNAQARGERVDLTKEAGDRMARMGLDAAAAEQVATKTTTKPLGKK